MYCSSFLIAWMRLWIRKIHWDRKLCLTLDQHHDMNFCPTCTWPIMLWPQGDNYNGTFDWLGSILDAHLHNRLAVIFFLFSEGLDHQLTLHEFNFQQWLRILSHKCKKCLDKKGAINSYLWACSWVCKFFYLRPLTYLEHGTSLKYGNQVLYSF